jgi:outer membrane protein, heavy metal efflux system
MNLWIRPAGAIGLAGLAIFSCPVVLAQRPHPNALTLDQALQEAAVHSPAMRARRAAVGQAEGRLTDAASVAHDPRLTFEAARREGGGRTDTDRELRLSQSIEIGGQRRMRRERFEAELSAARSQLLREERLLAAQVASAFVEALRLRDLVAVESANAALIRSLAEVARKRFDAGAVAQMEVNLARVQLGRAERDLRLTRGAYEVACASLAEAIGLDPTQPLTPIGTLEIPRQQTAGLEDLVQGALRNRADLEALRISTEAASARIALARKQAIPDLDLEAFHGREEGSDRLLGAAIGLRIPLFHRNRGAVAEARAAQLQAVAERETRELQVRQQIAAARARYLATAEATAALSAEVLGTLEENLHLLQRSFESGKTGWTDVLVFRREFVDIQRDYVETLSDAWLAAIELDLAAGLTPDLRIEESRP